MMLFVPRTRSLTKPFVKAYLPRSLRTRSHGKTTSANGTTTTRGKVQCSPPSTEPNLLEPSLQPLLERRVIAATCQSALAATTITVVLVKVPYARIAKGRVTRLRTVEALHHRKPVKPIKPSPEVVSNVEPLITSETTVLS